MLCLGARTVSRCSHARLLRDGWGFRVCNVFLFAPAKRPPHVRVIRCDVGAAAGAAALASRPSGFLRMGAEPARHRRPQKRTCARDRRRALGWLPLPAPGPGKPPNGSFDHSALVQSELLGALLRTETVDVPRLLTGEGLRCETGSPHYRSAGAGPVAGGSGSAARSRAPRLGRACRKPCGAIPTPPAKC